MASAGGSAEEQARRLIDEAGAWAAGAEGERRVATALDELPAAWTVVHDRLLRPGRSEANLDHIVIGPGGVFLVDAKNRAGTVVEYEGGLFQHRTRNGVRESVSLAAELAKVHGMAAAMAAESGVRVQPVLCLAGVQEKGFGEPRMVRGVWVVPVSAVAGWLRSRPVNLSPDEVARTATRVITDFPSTTTDPDLLAAMGRAAAQRPLTRRQVGREGRRQPQVRRQPERRVPSPASAAVRRPSRRWGRRLVSVVGRLVILGLGLTLLFSVIDRLPDILNGLPDAGEPRTENPVLPGSHPGPDCANASAAEIKAIIKRTVKPVAVSRGCAWGTRLDDQSTLLVTIVLSDGHTASDTPLVTSAKQRRVVFGSALDSSSRPATKASVAAGQPIVRGAKPVRARADTEVVVATQKLGVSDDRARQMAVAIAAAANAGG